MTAIIPPEPHEFVPPPKGYWEGQCGECYMDKKARWHITKLNKNIKMKNVKKVPELRRIRKGGIKKGGN